MIKINLLPVRAAQKKERIRGQFAVLILSLIAISLGCAGAYLQLDQKIQEQQSEISQKRNKINALQKKIGEVGRFKKLQEELRGKLEVLDKLKQGRTGPVRYLDELSRVIPEKMWLTEFEEKSGNVKIKGVALDEKMVAEFMRSLGNSQYFEGVNLIQTEQKTEQGLKLQIFQLTCKTRLTEKSS